MSRTGCSGCPAARPDGRVRRTIDAPLAAGGAPQRTVRIRMQRAIGACRSALGTDGGVGGAVQVARRCGTQTHGEPGDEADSEWFHHASFSVTCPHTRMRPRHIVPAIRALETHTPWQGGAWLTVNMVFLANAA